MVERQPGPDIKRKEEFWEERELISVNLYMKVWQKTKQNKWSSSIDNIYCDFWNTVKTYAVLVYSGST